MGSRFSHCDTDRDPKIISQMHGIHTARDTRDCCFQSRPKRYMMNRAASNSASRGGMAKTYEAVGIPENRRLYALKRLREETLQFKSSRTLMRPYSPMLDRSSGSSISLRIAFAKAISSLGATYSAALPAEIRVSAKSKETIGFPSAMYS